MDRIIGALEIAFWAIVCLDMLCAVAWIALTVHIKILDWLIARDRRELAE